ncbi:MAG TPA: hypothetical protein VGN72_21440 [Tepidisphaeraceae bacterium]|nr:hypothetical protein [Tepidisphaeraceae bacterium]
MSSSADSNHDLPLAAGRDGASLVLPWLTAAWLVSIVFGAVLLPLVGSPAGNEMTLDRALFVATNAATLTGFGGAGMDTLNVIGRNVLLMLTAGGTIYTLTVGGTLLSRILRLPYTAWDLFWVAAMAVGAIFLLVTIATPSRSVELMQQLSLGGLGNSGLIVGGRPPAVDRPIVHLIVLPLAVLGGLGLPVLLNLWHALRRREAVHPYVSLVLRLTAGAYLLGFAIIFACHLLDGRMGTSMVVSSSVASLDARSLGMGFESISNWPRTVPWVLMPLMILGAAPGGTAGGITLLAPVLLWIGLRRTFSGESAGRAFGIACVWLVIYTVALSLTTLGLVATTPQVGGDRLLFMAVSAVGTVGLSHEPVSIVGPPLHVLTLAMLFGRLAPLAVMAWLDDRD